MIALLQEAWRRSAVLTLTAGLLLISLVISLIGLAIDPSIITGAPAWLKPAKFGISTAIYCFTLAWMFRYITVYQPLIRVAAWVTSIALIVEVVIIDIQAARGVTSHFNVSSAFEGMLFSIMGGFIALLWLASVAILFALARQSFQDPAWGWALRLGMLLTVIGSASGAIMLRLTPAQLQDPHSTTAGAHTVGGPDGGPGLPVVGWSTEHGDLRIGHFLGLHALQTVPFFGWILTRIRRVTASQRITLTFLAASLYGTLFLWLEWQALHGRPVV